VSSLPGQPRVVGPGGLYFWLLGNPVRIRHSFWLLALVLVASGGNRSLVEAVGFVTVVAVSILWHELGHATVARALGQRPVIDLHGMGGTTTWTPSRPLRWYERLAVSLAGPAVGLIAGFVVYGLVRSSRLRSGSPTVDALVGDFLWVNIGWGIFNLLPILPLDGGAILAALLEGRMGPRGLPAARWTSVVVGAACALLALLAHMPWAAAVTGLFAFNNYQLAKGGAGLRV
jgi:Zn-dependent protease